MNNMWTHQTNFTGWPNESAPQITGYIMRVNLPQQAFDLLLDLPFAVDADGDYKGTEQRHRKRPSDY